jgi:o-succinylbenzoate synthase
MRIEKIQLYRLRIPLKQPYRISSAEIRAFDSTIVCLEAEGRQGFGEAMADVKGYFWETAEGVWDFAREKGPQLLGLEISDAHSKIRSFTKAQPCATTPFLTAMEMVSGRGALAPPSDRTRVPMVAILQASHREAVTSEIKRFIREGYRTIKVKVGFDVDEDLRRVGWAQEALEGSVRIRLDANQGYTFPQAKRLVQNIDPQGIEFLEQPFPQDDWDAMMKLSRISPIPLGLDESIYGMESVEKARKLKCAQFVKFKLMKIGSAEALLEHIQECQEYGLGVVLGNGAAGEISCYHEALLASKAAVLVGEMNGYQKQRDFIFTREIQTFAGQIELLPQCHPQLDPAKIDAYAIDRMHIGP